MTGVLFQTVLGGAGVPCALQCPGAEVSEVRDSTVSPSASANPTRTPRPRPAPRAPRPAPAGTGSQWS